MGISNPHVSSTVGKVMSRLCRYLAILACSAGYNASRISSRAAWRKHLSGYRRIWVYRS